MIMKCRLRILILIPLLALCFAGFTQPVQGSATLASDHKTLLYPWAGGLNACQFCSIDLNLDGTPDLLIFDRQGNRRLTFIASKINGNISYAFSPEFALKLPILHDWVQAVDYNHDGKMDLFTYGNGGIRVFRNVSDTALKFALVTDLLQSYYYTGYVGILVTSVDYPAIADIDGDGDLDLLTFFGLGSYVEYHKNQSFEKYGNYDSLDYKLSDHCWGKFKESESGNRITLNAVCPYMEEPLTSRPSNDRHTGSTLLATDLNKNGLQDLLLGDYDYPGITALFNGGTTDTAFMVAQDTLFPAGSKAISLFSFPVVSQVDINQDGLKDLVVSPFDPNLYNAENYNCTWFYKNTGTPEVPHYSYVTDRLFREDMMDFGSCSPLRRERRLLRLLLVPERNNEIALHQQNILFQEYRHCHGTGFHQHHRRFCRAFRIIPPRTLPGIQRRERGWPDGPRGGKQRRKTHPACAEAGDRECAAIRSARHKLAEHRRGGLQHATIL